MDNIENIVREKEFWLWIVAALSGWIYSIFRFFVSRYNQLYKLADRKYEAYSLYMKKIDEVMQNVQKDPSEISNVFNDFVVNILNNSENQEVMNNELIKFNQKLGDFIMRSTEPLIILKNELNNLLLLCSDELKQRIDELIKLTQDYNNAVQKTMGVNFF
jgi:hypothetical protein